MQENSFSLVLLTSEIWICLTFIDGNSGNYWMAETVLQIVNFDERGYPKSFPVYINNAVVLKNIKYDMSSAFCLLQHQYMNTEKKIASSWHIYSVLFTQSKFTDHKFASWGFKICRACDTLRPLETQF